MAINRGTWLSCATAVCLSAGLNAGAQAATGETLYSFGKNGGAGYIPLAGVYIDPDGNLFGTLSDIDSRNRQQNGVAYELSLVGTKWHQKTLHQFKPSKGDGFEPTGTLLPDGTGALYGTTCNCRLGRPPGGTVFKLTPPTNGVGDWTESILYSFNGHSEGAGTGGGLIFDSKGSLYLTHGGGGTAQGYGTVSILIPPAQGGTAWTNSTIYTFQGGTDGEDPSGLPLVFDASGALYGVTQFGGGGTICGTGYGCGTVYKLTPPAQGNGPWTETILYTFTGGADGSEPNSNLVFDKNGNLYSTTTVGGTNNLGTVFELSPPTNGQTAWTENVIHSFSYSNDFTYPQGNTVMTTSGNLLVSAGGGGPNNAGAIIQLSPPTAQGAWTETVLYSFSTGNGDVPVGMTLDTDGNIYGTTIYGGNRGGHGVAFEVNP